MLLDVIQYRTNYTVSGSLGNRGRVGVQVCKNTVIPAKREPRRKMFVNSLAPRFHGGDEKDGGDGVREHVYFPNSLTNRSS
jgi:hypothetical protein